MASRGLWGISACFWFVDSSLPLRMTTGLPVRPAKTHPVGNDAYVRGIPGQSYNDRMAAHRAERVGNDTVSLFSFGR